MTRTHKFLLLISLYIAQGLPYGFFTQSLPALLRDEGVGLEIIGLSSLLVLPWAFKCFWAPWVDKIGHYRWWVLAANGGAVMTLFILSSQPLTELLASGVGILLFGFFILNLLSATQDIATDSIAINLLSVEERGIGNGIQVAGYRVGMITAGGLLLAWFSQLGWQYSLWILAALLLLSSLPALFIGNTRPALSSPLTLKDFSQFFKLSSIWGWIAILVACKFGDYLAGTMVRPLLIDNGLSLKDIAWVLGTVGFVAGLLGALLGGYWVTVLGRFRALMIFATLQAITLSGWALLPAGIADWNLILTLSAVEHFCGGLVTASLFTVMMDKSRKQCAASDYAIQASIVVFTSIAAASLSGILAQQIGFLWHFIIAALLSGLCLPLIFAHRQHFISTSQGQL
ncbi:MFS transporter [Pleionea sp. CnH1-48]|uniref:MFS transporter n=1 Tax=Pleionea sp. CnH1-48 TaxID=2954494 RepID=UPI002096A8F1|nr:MFS transporter [Pleionea sp. CnH1-48]MCO7224915.1 MFS transporter [Pleionea sp. CnH1-48]